MKRGVVIWWLLAAAGALLAVPAAYFIYLAGGAACNLGDSGTFEDAERCHRDTADANGYAHAFLIAMAGIFVVAVALAAFRRRPSAKYLFGALLVADFLVPFLVLVSQAS